jgi:hypothetical protein
MVGTVGEVLELAVVGAESKVAIIVEGEVDKLSLEEAGIRHVVSVPDGAPKAVKDSEPSGLLAKEPQGYFVFPSHHQSP